MIEQQKEVFRLQEEVIETNKNVQEVVDGYHKAIEKQSEKNNKYI